MTSSRRASSVNVWLALGTVYVVWGSTYLAIAIAVETLPPLFYSGIRFALAGLILAAWLAFRHVDLRISRRELGGAAAVGILMLAGGNGLVSLAERTVPSGVAALIVASIPLCIVVYRVIAGERVRRDLLSGVLLGLVGVAILVVPGGLNGTIDPVGALMLFGATLSWALGTFLSPRLETPRNALVSTAYQMLAGGVVLIGLSRLDVRIRESGRRGRARCAHPRRADHHDHPDRRRGHRRRCRVHRLPAERRTTCRAVRADRGGRGLGSRELPQLALAEQLVRRLRGREDPVDPFSRRLDAS
jgi:threonine/homoserine efflux transporter RhtA